MLINQYNLKCKYDTRASFYGKAQVTEETYTIENDISKKVCLYSYNTLVAEVFYNINGSIDYVCFGRFSQTTTRHQKEFFRQHGLSDKEIKEIFKSGVIIKGDDE